MAPLQADEATGRAEEPLTVVLDLDDTLCDYSGARASALVAISDTFGPRAEVFRRTYLELEPPLFRRYVAGELSLDRYRRERFAGPLQAVALECDLDEACARLNDEYMRRCNEGVALFDDTWSALRRLQGLGVSLALLTNGPADGQRTKLRALGLEAVFDGVFVSGETGVSKPDPSAFAQVETAWPARRIAMIGDSLEVDILPAVRRGWTGLWVRRGPGAAGGVPAGVVAVGGLEAAVDVVRAL